MRLHWLQHVPFEGLGYIDEWANSRGFEISCTRLYAGEKLPAVESFDWLVVMGGPMGIHDHDEHSWLAAEKEFIGSAIAAGKTMLGICLGAQLMADALGAKVYPSPQKEIGWFPIQRAHGAPGLLPGKLTVFHWHGDTFDLPDGAIRLADSEVCGNQAFIHGDRVIGLQFHMETTGESMEALIDNCAHELEDSPFIQTADEMRAGLSNIGRINKTLEELLDSLSSSNHEA